MTAAPRAAADAPATPAPAKRPAKRGAGTGAAPAKKATKRAAPAKKRAPTGAKRTEGAILRAELGADRDTVMVKALIRQAARHADRLEAIDRVLSGEAKAWASVGLPRITDGGVAKIEVRVDDLVKEERSQATALRSLLAEIHRQRSGLPAAPPGPGQEDDDLKVE